MIRLTIGGVDVHDYLTSYSPLMELVKGGNDFTNYDGTRIIDSLGTKITLSFSLAKLPTSISRQLADIVKSPSFEVIYTDPFETKSTFTLKSYNSSSRFTDPRNKDFSDTSNITWNVDMSIESLAATESGSL